MKTLLDVNKSLDLCPPSYPSGVIFKKRITAKRGKNGIVTYPIDKNPREHHVILTKIPELRDSLLVNGYIYSCSPPTVKIDPNNKDRFIGLSGYHRDAAAEQAGWETMIYDVLEFQSPLDERKHKSTSNHHKTPSIPNTIMDIVKQVKEAVAEKEITNEDSDVKDLISVLAADKTKSAQTKIFNKFRTHVSSSSTLRNYHTEGGELSTEEFCILHNLPFGGDKFFDKTRKLGYVTGIKTPKTTLFDAKRLSQDYNGQEVEVYAWIQDNPKSAPAIYVQRQKWKDTFDKFIVDDCKSIQFLAKLSGYDISLDVLIKNHPVKFKGFLAQDISPDPMNGGKPKEEGVVDVNGNKLR
jgi:hypothetical protein